MSNFLFAHDHYHNKLPFTFNNIFSYTINRHSHDTRIIEHQPICLPKVNTQTHGINSIKYQSVKHWSTINNTLSNHELPLKKRTYCKKIISKFIINDY